MAFAAGLHPDPIEEPVSAELPPEVIDSPGARHPAPAPRYADSIKSVVVGIVEQMRCKVHVGTLFFGLDDFDVFLRLARGHDFGHPDVVRQIVAEHDLCRGQSAQCAQVGLLTFRLIRIIWASRYQRREILDSQNVVLRQQWLAELLYVQPTIRCPLQAPVVQIERIDIDASTHQYPQKSRGHPKVAPRPATEATGEMFAVFNRCPAKR